MSSRGEIFKSVAASRPPRNSFDLSHNNKLTTDMGRLTPILRVECMPGDVFHGGSDAFIRLAPLVAPVMHQIDAYIHYYFVPYRILWKDWEKFITSPTSGDTDYAFPVMTFNNNAVYNNGNLSDYLGLPPQPSSIASTALISQMPFRAYQKIYDDYYRDNNLIEEQFTEDLYESGGLATTSQQLVLTSLRTRAYEKDYFTSALPFPQAGSIQAYLPIDLDVQGTFSGVAPAGAPLDFVDRDDKGIEFYGVDPPALTPGAIFNGGVGNYNYITDTLGSPVDRIAGKLNTPIPVAGVVDVEAVGTSVTINDLRVSIRLQEWLERTARGGERYIEQLYSHFGVRSSDKRLQRAEYLGGGKMPITISTVMQTSESTQNSPQANPAGNGHASGFSSFRTKQIEEHGIIIGIMSIRPRTAYFQGIHRDWTRFKPLDFAWPEFAQLGEQEVFTRELFYQGQPAGQPDNWNSVFGYQSRYSDYKYKPDEIHGAFRDTLDFWHLARKFDTPPLLNQTFVEVTNDKRIFAVTDVSEDCYWCELYNKVQVSRLLPFFGTPIL